MFEDLVLKAQGLQAPVTINGYTFKEEVLTDFAYLTKEKFRIAVFLKDNPKSSASEISNGTGYSLASVYSFVRKMLHDNLLTRIGRLFRNSIKYIYSISLGGFELDENIKRINEKETTVLDFLIESRSCGSTKISDNTGLRKKNIYYLMRVLVEKGMVSSFVSVNLKRSYKITIKGRRTIDNGGIYEA